MKLFQSATLMAFTATSSAIKVLLPLYNYPDSATPSTPAAWQPVYDVLTAYPSVNFQIIVNPDSGPGCSKCAAPTDANFIDAISALNRYPNVQTLGYVRTGYTKRSYAAVTRDVSAYASWSAYKAANVSIAGIFFDEVSAAAKSRTYAYYQKISAFARAHMPPRSQVVMNPGEPAPAKLFGYADVIVESEIAYADYSYPGIVDAFTAGYNAQAAVILYKTPGATELEPLVRDMTAKGIAAVYVCPDADYNDLSLLKNLTAAVTAE